MTPGNHIWMWAPICGFAYAKKKKMIGLITNNLQYFKLNLFTNTLKSRSSSPRYLSFRQLYTLDQFFAVRSCHKQSTQFPGTGKEFYPLCIIVKCVYIERILQQLFPASNIAYDSRLTGSPVDYKNDHQFLPNSLPCFVSCLCHDCQEWQRKTNYTMQTAVIARIRK